MCGIVPCIGGDTGFRQMPPTLFTIVVSTVFCYPRPLHSIQRSRGGSLEARGKEAVFTDGAGLEPSFLDDREPILSQAQTVEREGV